MHVRRFGFRGLWTLAAALLIAAMLPAMDLSACASTGGAVQYVASPEALKAALEGEDNSPITLGALIMVPQEMQIALTGDKVIQGSETAYIYLAGQVSIPVGSSLIIEGGGLLCESAGPTCVSLEGSLSLKGAEMLLYVNGEGVGLANEGGSLSVNEGLLGIMGTDSGVGILNGPGGRISLRNSEFQVVSQGADANQVSVALYNQGGEVILEGCDSYIANSGATIALLNREGSADISGGLMWAQNHDRSAGIYNVDTMRFSGLPIYLNSMGSSGLDNYGGEMAFEGCTLEFFSGSDTPANLYNEGGTMFFANTAIVTAGEGGTCIENVGGTLTSGGGNTLLEIESGRVVYSNNEQTLDNWAGQYYPSITDNIDTFEKSCRTATNRLIASTYNRL